MASKMSQRRLTIGIDARLLKLRRGMGNYVHALLDEFINMHVEHRIIAYVDDAAMLKHLSDSPLLDYRVIKPSFYPVCEQFTLPHQAAKDRIDILHCPANTAPIHLSSLIKLVVTIHDIMYLLPSTALPQSRSLYQQLGRRYRAWVVPRIAKLADAVITDAYFSKNDILNHIQIPPNKISVIHLSQGHDVKRGDQKDIEQVLANYSITTPYLFALGAIDPRKNTTRIIQAFAEFVRSIRPHHTLVFTGLAGTDQDAFVSIAKAENISSKVKFLPFVSRKELIALYSGAEMFLYPSLYEGFGFPVLEAMACGTPVITTAVTSIPEIAGDAALFVDPLDVSEIAAAITSIVMNVELKRAYREKGREQATQFSWRRTAQETIKVYEAVAGDK